MKYATFNDVGYALGVVAKNTAMIMKKESAMNARIEDIKKKFSEEVKELAEENGKLTGEITAYCEANKSSFEKQRTMKFSSGEIGFRNNPPKVLQLNRKYNTQTSIELIKKIFGVDDYIRVKEEINKDSLLTDYAAKELGDSQLASVGLKIDQGETFFINPEWKKLVEKNSVVKTEA
jgi:phage host-nuclease inhibitor protein Gam